MQYTQSTCTGESNSLFTTNYIQIASTSSAVHHNIITTIIIIIITTTTTPASQHQHHITSITTIVPSVGLTLGCISIPPLVLNTLQPVLLTLLLDQLESLQVAFYFLWIRGVVVFASVGALRSGVLGVVRSGVLGVGRRRGVEEWGVVALC